MSSKTPEIKHENLQNLREQAINAAIQCEAISQEAEQKMTLLEETREMFINLESEFKYLTAHNPEDYAQEDKDAAFHNISVLIHNLAVTKDELNEHEQDCKMIQIRLSLAFKLAKKYEHLLAKAQQTLINARIQLKQPAVVNKPIMKPWAPEVMHIPEKDPKALQFYEQLSQENKKKFDDLHRRVFYQEFGGAVEDLKRSYKENRGNKEDHQLPNHPKLLVFDDKMNLESLIASRMVILAFQENVEVNDESLNALREAAVKQLEVEHMKILKAKNVEDKNETQRQGNVQRWKIRQKGKK